MTLFAAIKGGLVLVIACFCIVFMLLVVFTLIGAVFSALHRGFCALIDRWDRAHNSPGSIL